jgi:hypothetical protein
VACTLLRSHRCRYRLKRKRKKPAPTTIAAIVYHHTPAMSAVRVWIGHSYPPPSTLLALPRISLGVPPHGTHVPFTRMSTQSTLHLSRLRGRAARRKRPMTLLVTGRFPFFGPTFCFASPPKETGLAKGTGRMRAGKGWQTMTGLVPGRL